MFVHIITFLTESSFIENNRIAALRELIIHLCHRSFRKHNKSRNLSYLRYTFQRIDRKKAGQ